MPIDYKKYPANWLKEIRPAALERAQHKCEFCGVDNYATGYRNADGTFNAVESYSQSEADDLDGIKYIKIVLTVAHLDHDITNNAPDNLKALCQKCHLNYDKEHHQKNAANTRAAKKSLPLFETPHAGE